MLKIVETFGRSGHHPEPGWGSSQRSPHPVAGGGGGCCPYPGTPFPLSSLLQSWPAMKIPGHALESLVGSGRALHIRKVPHYKHVGKSKPS